MSRKSKATESERLVLAKAINAVVAKQESFTKTIESLENLQRKILEEFDLKIDTKKKELAELTEKAKISKNHYRIEADQFLAEHKYTGAVKLLAEVGEIAIKKTDLDSLKKEIETLRTEKETEIKDIIKKERDSAHTGLKTALTNCDLKHKAETAVIQATIEQQKKEIKSLENVITNLQNEVGEQRKLTQQVAEAGRKSAINQTFGK